MSQKSRKYEDNYTILEKITESLNKDEVGIDDLVEKTREALGAARVCMEILNEQKGEFQKLETEFSQLLRSSSEVAASAVNSEPVESSAAGETAESDEPTEDRIGQDDPF
ncbi:MAG: exodeoxyribonuclease VII small subunit [Candidatus Aminicenantes bacterium]|nr:exodeoxyribonuclease VII small subunit [Candidatus Aminicenantes bacterium]